LFAKPKFQRIQNQRNWLLLPLSKAFLLEVFSEAGQVIWSHRVHPDASKSFFSGKRYMRFIDLLKLYLCLFWGTRGATCYISEAIAQ
jgi:hypothetical protein